MYVKYAYSHQSFCWVSPTPFLAGRKPETLEANGGELATVLLRRQHYQYNVMK